MNIQKTESSNKMGLGRKIVVGVLIVLTLVAVYLLYGYYNKSLTGEEFMTRMEMIGYTGNDQGSNRKSDDIPNSKMYVAMGSRGREAAYSRIQLDVFGDTQDAADAYESFIAFYREHSDGLEITSNTTKKFVAYYDDRCIVFSRVKNTVLSATIPRSDVGKLRIALVGTAYGIN